MMVSTSELFYCRLVTLPPLTTHTTCRLGAASHTAFASQSNPADQHDLPRPTALDLGFLPKASTSQNSLLEAVVGTDHKQYLPEPADRPASRPPRHITATGRDLGDAEQPRAQYVRRRH